MIRISPNFYYEEAMVTAQRGLDNTPPLTVLPSLVMVFNEQMEQVRELLGCPIHVNSAYRSPEVNKAVGGAPSSQHTKGQAVDFVPMKEMRLRDAYDAIVESDIVFDQLIYEFGTWLHVSRPDFGNEPRRSMLMIGKWTDGAYLPYNSSSIP